MASTDTEVRKAKPAESAYRMTDSHSLYLWVTPSGGKLWRWAYKFDGKEKLMALGKYPAVTLALARERHAEGRKLLATGVDPMVARKTSKNAVQVANENSFASVSARWVEHWQDDKSPRHVDSTRRRLASNILPSLGSLQMTEIEAPDIVAMVRAVEARGARDVAKRALETTGQIFRYAIAHGYAKRNPATDVRPRDILKASLKSNYARIEAKELPNLLREIEVYPGTHVTRFAIKLIALTFVRTSELIGATWSEFDLEAARWNIPAERMKMRTQHIVPLSRQALEVLDSLRQLTDHGDWLFPGDRNSAKPMSNNTILKALERMGYKGKMTGHGFRGLASTILHERGYGHEHGPVKRQNARYDCLFTLPPVRDGRVLCPALEPCNTLERRCRRLARHKRGSFQGGHPRRNQQSDRQQRPHRILYKDLRGIGRQRKSTDASGCKRLTPPTSAP